MKIELKNNVFEVIKSEVISDKYYPNMTEEELLKYIEMFCNDERTTNHIINFICYQEVVNKRRNKWDRIKEKIIDDIKGSVDHYTIGGYSSWVEKLEKECKLQDEEREIYSDVLYDGFTNDELENIWKENQ